LNGHGPAKDADEAGGQLEPDELNPATVSSKREQTIRRHLRGSAVLLFGRGLGILLNLVVQVLLVRSLSVTEFGAFAYVLALATFLGNCFRLGLDKGVDRFVSIHEERHEYAEMAGVAMLALALTFCIGVTGVGAIYLAEPWLGPLIPAEVSRSLLLIMVCLAPLQALDTVLTRLLAIFASARILAMRRHILIPTLRLVAVSTLLILGEDVEFLAAAWVASMVLAVGLSVVIIARILQERTLLDWFKPAAAIFQPKTLLRFSVPLISFELVYAMRNQVVVFLLGLVQSAMAVAAFRAVLPVARLNVLIFESFRSLYMPMAARMYARGDTDGMSALYWQSSGWILVLTYPLFLVTFVLAEPLTILLFGERYEGSGTVLRWLSVGFFLNAVGGTNTLSLHVVGYVRTAVRIDMVALSVALLLNVLLIWHFSAIGGAIASCLTLIVQNGLTQWVLMRKGVIGMPVRQFRRAAALALVATVVAVTVDSILDPVLFLKIFVVLVAGAVVFVVGLRELDLEETFPELARVPILGPVLLGARR